MSVVSLVKRIQKKTASASGYGVPEILNEINAAQNYIFQRPCRQTIFLNPATGLPPFLPTSVGQMIYDVPDVSVTLDGTTYPLRIYQVTRVFVDVTVVAEYNLPYVGEIFELGIVNPFSTQIVIKKFARIPCDSYNATETERARVVFQSDPGNTTDAYYCEGVMEPLQISSANQPLMLPQKFEQAIFDYVVGNIQDTAYGKDSRINRFYEYWCPQVWEEMDSGTSSRRVNTPVFY